MLYAIIKQWAQKNGFFLSNKSIRHLVGYIQSKVGKTVFASIKMWSDDNNANISHLHILRLIVEVSKIYDLGIKRK